MSKTIEANSRFLLLAILAEIEQFAEVSDDGFESGHPFVEAIYRHGVPFSPAFWVGKTLSSTRRMAYSRAARRLAKRGLVKRVTEPRRDRVRYLIPTLAGLLQALELAGSSADRQAVREGLSRTSWGRSLAKKLGGGV